MTIRALLIAAAQHLASRYPRERYRVVVMLTDEAGDFVAVASNTTFKDARAIIACAHDAKDSLLHVAMGADPNVVLGSPHRYDPPTSNGNRICRKCGVDYARATSDMCTVLDGEDSPMCLMTEPKKARCDVPGCPRHDPSNSKPR